MKNLALLGTAIDEVTRKDSRAGRVAVDTVLQRIAQLAQQPLQRVRVPVDVADHIQSVHRSPQGPVLRTNPDSSGRLTLMTDDVSARQQDSPPARLHREIARPPSSAARTEMEQLPDLLIGRRRKGRSGILYGRLGRTTDLSALLWSNQHNA
jgi:hypothetical protein